MFSWWKLDKIYSYLKLCLHYMKLRMAFTLIPMHRILHNTNSMLNGNFYGPLICKQTPILLISKVLLFSKALMFLTTWRTPYFLKGLNIAGTSPLLLCVCHFRELLQNDDNIFFIFWFFSVLDLTLHLDAQFAMMFPPFCGLSLHIINQSFPLLHSAFELAEHRYYFLRNIILFRGPYLCQYLEFSLCFPLTVSTWMFLSEGLYWIKDGFCTG